ncbi:MAG: hypothetical protein MRY64_12015 [Hyphomonadaceae bacterium]|nr:hypothetical protein [Hyphomonadaceae bacterium]
MTYKSGLLALVAALTLAMPAGALTAQEAAQCRVMSQSFGVRQAEVLELQERQAELATLADELGAAWELKEEVRNFSAGHAAEADEARIAFDEAKMDAMRVTADLRSKAQMLNADVAQFNARCASD